MEIKLNITDKNDIAFFKEFYMKHGLSTKDNLCTYKPIHIVQSENHIYVPYDENLINTWSDDWEMCFMETSDNSIEKCEVEFLKDFFDIDARPYEELECEELELNGQNFGIYSYDDYFEYYGLESSDYEIVCRKPYWENRAYFFIRDQAEQYLKYQKHNLGKAQIYTESPGYANYGEYDTFYDTLLRIGKAVYNGEQVLPGK